MVSLTVGDLLQMVWTLFKWTIYRHLVHQSKYPSSTVSNLANVSVLVS